MKISRIVYQALHRNKQDTPANTDDEIIILITINQSVTATVNQMNRQTSVNLKCPNTTTRVGRHDFFWILCQIIYQHYGIKMSKSLTFVRATPANTQMLNEIQSDRT